ncbi:ABC transporter permease [Allosediminivita pacifica]|uniref:Putative spermidine/putrescine transport system permease protein n=1 Tax=Allosediminivita pacifica TaxID=1267769 RepID=A0A2T6A038_9RHOB|nr:ABC transporter permease [Allosediminivita pacifica]PTX37166.1 putative spermidine/putrescine transport system permease protein [Allosediminivita pacifica]GGB30301.1 ABC transporter permease [Allosediminivita pacifica]
MSSSNGFWSLAFHTLFVIFVMAPIVVVCFMAFTPEGYLSMPTNGVSLRWFEALLNNKEFVGSFRISLALGAASATVAALISIPAAMAIVRYDFPGRTAFLTLCMSPLMVPSIVLGVAFLRFFSQIGMSGTLVGLTISHVILIVPYVLRTIMNSLGSLDSALDHAAASLGSSAWRTFRRVTLPLTLPGILSGWVLAFITSFDEVTMTIFISGPGTTTLPVRLMLYIEDSIDPLVAAVSTVLIVMALVVMLILDRLFGLDRMLIGRSPSDPDR